MRNVPEITTSIQTQITNTINHPVNTHIYITCAQNHPQTKRMVSGHLKKVVAAEQLWKCFLCHQLLSACFEVDHWIPLKRGGSNRRDNLVALCRECHGMKTVHECI
jgi:5-methylcytosine-specific restriction endonuclease McrA